MLAAADGTEAIGILGDGQRIDLLFTDIVMPLGISGVESPRRRSACTPTSRCF